jgi:hypothetical protein
MFYEFSRERMKKIKNKGKKLGKSWEPKRDFRGIFFSCGF